MRLERDQIQLALNSISLIRNNYYASYQQVPYSRYGESINVNTGRLSGFSREAGATSNLVKEQVKKLILEESQKMTIFDKSALLAIAEHESGFNPDAAAKESSASGIFQIIKGTAQKLDLSSNKVFEARDNIRAGIRLYQENLRIVNSQYPHLKDLDRVSMLYALHHDGPSLKYGGWDIAQKKVVPKFYKYFKEIGGLRM